MGRPRLMHVKEMFYNGKYFLAIKVNYMVNTTEKNAFMVIV